MKIAQKVTLMFLSLMIVSTVVCAEDDQYVARGLNVIQQVRADTLRLFSPMPQDGAQKRIDALRKRIVTRVAGGQEYAAAFMVETEKFLLSELRVAVTQAAELRKEQVDVDLCAEQLLDLIVIKRYGTVFEKTISDLPNSCFTSCLSDNVTKALLVHGLPQQTRDAASLLHYAGTLYETLEFVKIYCQKFQDAMVVSGIV